MNPLKKNTFFHCLKLKSFIIPKITSLCSIGNKAFGFCHNILTFFIPKNIDFIENFAFIQCTKLQYFYYFGKKEPQISKNSFSRCKNLLEIYVINAYRSNSFGGIKVKAIHPN